jgi:HlyD family secretion protein
MNVNRRLIGTTAACAIAAAIGLGVYRHAYPARRGPYVSTSTVTRGDIVESVTATGTLGPLRSVDIGSQVSGTVKKLYVDFNSIVKQGQLLAELDPALFQAALDSATASLAQAQVALDQQRQVLEVDARNRERTEALLEERISTQQEVDDARVAQKQDEAMILEDQASVDSAKSAVHQAELNLSHCSIYAPTDGVVISRNVDEGQTVVAQVSAPSLYLLGTDLRQLQLIGDVDESDVGRLRPGQRVSFTVDAYPGTRFAGEVTNVRLNSTTTNGVVTYQVVVTTPNPELRLLPGMTATLTIQISGISTVVRVPNAALRFRPTAETFKALGQPVPDTIPNRANAARSGDRSSSTASPPASTARTIANTHADEIDELFEPVLPRKVSGEVWRLEKGKLVRIPVEAGRSDGTWSELLSGDLHPGDDLVTSVMQLFDARK